MLAMVFFTAVRTRACKMYIQCLSDWVVGTQLKLLYLLQKYIVTRSLAFIYLFYFIFFITLHYKLLREVVVFLFEPDQLEQSPD